MNSGIYIIRNTINNKIYIGSSVNLDNRWSKHKSQLSKNIHGNKHLQFSFNKYGLGSFTFEVLANCNKEDLLYFEQKCIDLLKPEYNICKIANSPLGLKRTPEQRAKLSAALKGRTAWNKGIAMPEQTRLAINKANTGAKRTEETKLKMSIAQMGNTNSKKRVA